MHGAACQDMTAISSTCTWRKQSNTRWGEDWNAWLVGGFNPSENISQLGWLRLSSIIMWTNNKSPKPPTRWNMLKRFWHIRSQRQIRFALSQICREVISGTSKDQRGVRQVRGIHHLQDCRALNVSDFRQKNIEKTMKNQWILSGLLWIIFETCSTHKLSQTQCLDKRLTLCAVRKVCPMHCSTSW